MSDHNIIDFQWVKAQPLLAELDPDFLSRYPDKPNDEIFLSYMVCLGYSWDGFSWYENNPTCL